MFTLPAAASPTRSVAPSATPGGSGDGFGTQPSTAEEAKQDWLAASNQSEVADEQLLDARAAEKTAKAKAATAQVTVARARLAAGIAESKSVQAAAELSSYQQQLAAFASASFRGARLGQLSALLTAQSSTDYLDEVTSLDQVADHTKTLMANALAAKKAAAAASAAAGKAAADAEVAKTSADTAAAKAAAATTSVAAHKVKLDAEVATYHTLFNSLTVKERQEAIDEQQAAWEQAATAAAAAAASSAAAPRRPRRPRLSSSAARLAAAAAAAANAAKQQAPAIAVAPPDSSTSAASTSTSSKTSSSASSSASASAKSTTAAPSSTPAAKTRGQIAVDAALTKLGYRYIYGAAGPNAFDCSGLTSWAWAQAGVSIPHSSSAQSGYPYVPLDQLQPGDLVTYYSPVHHVALYIGNGQIIDASTESKPIFITSVYRGGPDPTGHRVNY